MKILTLIGAVVTVGFVILTMCAVWPRKGQRRMVYHLERERAADSAWVVVTRDGADHETVQTPWTLSFWAPPGTHVNLSAQYQQDSDKGSLEARLYADGQLLRRVRSSGSESVTIECTVP